MALVKCPECGKEKVSDTAEMCPDCGYGIKAHFDKIRKKEVEREQMRKMEEAQKEAKQHEEERMQRIKMPEKPKFNKGLTVYLIMISLFVLFTIIVSLLPDMDITIFIIVWRFCFPLIIIPLIVGLYYFNERRKEYKFAEEDFETYKKKIIAKENAQAVANMQVREEVISVECPYCHSNNTTKITTAAKAANTAMFGVLGQKRKYQWHCNNCKSDF